MCERVDGERGLVLLEEACRIADRLDRLDAVLAGEADVWARLVHRTRTDSYELVIDSAMGEARQHALALKQLLLSIPMAKESGDVDPDSWLDELPAEVRDS